MSADPASQLLRFLKAHHFVKLSQDESRYGAIPWEHLQQSRCRSLWGGRSTRVVCIPGVPGVPHDILFGWAFCHVLPRACSLSGQSSFGCSLIVEKCLSQKDTFLEVTSTFHQTSCSLSVRLWRTLRGAVEGQMRGESFS